MKRVHTAANLPEAHLIRDALEQNGITAHVFNANASSVAGELPLDAALPQVWIENPAQLAHAREVIAGFLRRPPLGPPLKCPGCGEENPSSFDFCWKCGKDLAR
ncbi:MAG TPA: DUF2007 domain-containing protein [Usitatibacter sp.]|nr:DUF2007 domain-containing protein [Usitatibacter sp.]